MSNSDEIRKVMTLLESASIQPVVEYEDEDEGYDDERGVTTEEVMMLVRNVLIEEQQGANEIAIKRVGGVDSSPGMNYINLELEDGSEYQVQVHLKRRGRMESIQEGPETSDIWLSNVADEAFTYSGVEELGYSTNELKEITGSLVQRGELSTDMTPGEAAAKVAQMVLQA